MDYICYFTCLLFTLINAVILLLNCLILIFYLYESGEKTPGGKNGMERKPGGKKAWSFFGKDEIKPGVFF